jgi:hypothetical protein
MTHSSRRRPQGATGWWGRGRTAPRAGPCAAAAAAKTPAPAGRLKTRGHDPPLFTPSESEPRRSGGRRDPGSGDYAEVERPLARPGPVVAHASPAREKLGS